jgi:hypothetical protein
MCLRGLGYFWGASFYEEGRRSRNCCSEGKEIARWSGAGLSEESYLRLGSFWKSFMAWSIEGGLSLDYGAFQGFEGSYYCFYEGCSIFLIYLIPKTPILSEFSGFYEIIF